MFLSLEHKYSVLNTLSKSCTYMIMKGIWYLEQEDKCFSMNPSHMLLQKDTDRVRLQYIFLLLYIAALVLMSYLGLPYSGSHGSCYWALNLTSLVTPESCSRILCSIPPDSVAYFLNLHPIAIASSPSVLCLR